MSTMQPPRAEGQGVTLLGRAPTEPVDLADVAVLLNPEDAVAIAKQPLLPRTVLRTADGEVRVAQMIPPGHKVALREVAEGGEVRRYGQIIGFATKDIAPGDHVHSHNLSVGEGLELDYAPSSEYRPVDYVPEGERRTFMGYPAQGRARRHEELRRHPGLGQLLVVGDAPGSRLFPGPGGDEGVPERRRRDPARHQGRLRGALRVVGSGGAAADDGGHRRPSERRRLRDPQPRLRGQPADRPHRVDRAWQWPSADGAHDPAGRRLRQDRRGRDRGGQAHPAGRRTRCSASRSRPPSWWSRCSAAGRTAGRG